MFIKNMPKKLMPFSMVLQRFDILERNGKKNGLPPIRIFFQNTSGGTVRESSNDACAIHRLQMMLRGE